MRRFAENKPRPIPLGSPDFTAAAVGVKAFSLHDLLVAGFPVPPGFVVPADANLDDIKSEVESAIESLGGYPLAARSSAQFEDLAGASFAGQYATYLKIADFRGLMEAILGCRASGRNGHAVSYLHKNGIGTND